jgi:hypothetical protein
MLEKAQIRVEGKNQAISVMFNPEKYAVTHTTLLKTESETDTLNPSFNGLKVEDFVVELMFDTYEKKSDVRKLTSDIQKLAMPTIEGTERKRPPVCLFVWGSFTFKGIISKVTQNFILFLSNGTPVRAKLEVTFESVMTPEEYAKNMGIEACRKVWTVKTGDRLDLIANVALKDPSLWRRIAEENNIDSPLVFPKDSDIGRILIIPD